MQRRKIRMIQSYINKWMGYIRCIFASTIQHLNILELLGVLNKALHRIHGDSLLWMDFWMRIESVFKIFTLYKQKNCHCPFSCPSSLISFCHFSRNCRGSFGIYVQWAMYNVHSAYGIRYKIINYIMKLAAASFASSLNIQFWQSDFLVFVPHIRSLLNLCFVNSIAFFIPKYFIFFFFFFAFSCFSPFSFCFFVLLEEEKERSSLTGNIEIIIFILLK